MTENSNPNNSADQVAQDVQPAASAAADNSDITARLLKANLRTEAVKAGMIDLDGLKLLDTSSIRLGQDDTIVGGQALMAEMRRTKPWLFGALSSSSALPVPSSQPVRQKMAMDMSDEEYAAARKAITKYGL